MKLLIENARIVTMNNNMDVVDNGSILIENNSIKRIVRGKTEEADAVVFDVGGMIVMPGFINTHTHLPMTLFRGYADDLPLHTWLNEYIFPAEARFISPENVRISTRIALIEMIKSGTTCFNDMYFFEDIIAEEAKKAGIRGIVGESLIDFPTPSFKTPEQGIARTVSLIEKWQGDETIHPSVCAHSPYTCSKELLLTAKRLADKYRTLLHIHVAETRKETEDVAEKTGMSPGEYLYSIGLLDKNVIAAHGVWLTPYEETLFSASGTAIAHNPKSNLKLGSGIADVDYYLKSGITVAIGTDGTASNNVLDMVEEMRFAALLPKGIHLNPEAVNAGTALRMATINGAKALNIEHLSGSLEEGKRADMIFIDSGAFNLIPVYDEFSALVYALNSQNIRHSMVNGSWIMKDRQLLHIDENNAISELLSIVPQRKS